MTRAFPPPATASEATSGGGTRGHGLSPPSGVSSTRQRIPASTGSALRVEAGRKRLSSVRFRPSSSRLLGSGPSLNFQETRVAPGNFVRMDESISSRDSSDAQFADRHVTDAPPPIGAKSTVTTAVSPTAARGAPRGRARGVNPPTASRTSPPTGLKAWCGPTCGRSLRTPERSSSGCASTWPTKKIMPS